MLINPRNLYSGGNVRLDSSPYLRMAMQQQYRQQARDEATNQYFSRLPDKLNEAGVRQQDLEDPEGNGGIRQDISNWKNKYMMNKSAIIRGGAAQQDFTSDFDKIKQRIDQSKNRSKIELNIGKEALKSNGWKPRESDHPVIDALSKSIYNPESRKQDGVSEYGMNDLSVNTPQLNLSTHSKAIEAGIVPDVLPDDKGVINDKSDKITYQKRYTPNQIKTIASNAEALAGIPNSSARNFYEDLSGQHDQVERASKALQTEYNETHTDGKQVIANTPEEMARGLALEKYTNSTTPKEVTNLDAIQKWKNEQLLQRQRFAASQTAIKEAGKNLRTNKLMAGAEIPKVYENVLDSPDEVIPTLAGDKMVLKNVTNLTNSQKDDLRGKKDKDNRYPNNFIEIGNQQYLKKNADGNLTDKDNKILDKDQTFASTYAKLQASKKAVAQGKIVPTVNNKAEIPSKQVSNKWDKYRKN